MALKYGCGVDWPDFWEFSTNTAETSAVATISEGIIHGHINQDTDLHSFSLLASVKLVNVLISH